MASYPTDRFDRPPADLQRVGAHRAPRPRGRGWIAFAWAALATGVLIGLGLLGMFLINDRVAFNNPLGNSTVAPSGSATPAATPTVQATLDPAVNVIILNGTSVAGLAGRAGDVLAAQGWTVAARSNATTQDVATTIVYYSDPSQEAAARGISAGLNGAPIQLSDQFKVAGENRITVVLGADYVPAG